MCPKFWGMIMSLLVSNGELSSFCKREFRDLSSTRVNYLKYRSISKLLILQRSDNLSPNHDYKLI
jgi:hypothetical protein